MRVKSLANFLVFFFMACFFYGCDGLEDFLLLVAFGVVAVVSGDCDGTDERGVPVLAVAAFAGWQEAEAGLRSMALSSRIFRGMDALWFIWRGEASKNSTKGKKRGKC